MNGVASRRVSVTVQTAPGVSGALPPAPDVTAWVQAAVAAAAAAPDVVAVTVRFVAADESAALNAQYRGKAAATNVLAFCSAPVVPGLLTEADAELGDLVICWPVAVAEAAEQGKSPLAHVAHLTVHGTLHLLGYDHEEQGAAEAMEALERGALATLNWPDPYAGDACPD